jgi:acyl-CoA thioesterase I
VSRELPLIDVVYFGDSITEGQYVDPAHRWTALVDEALDERYRDTRLHVRGLNRGVSGETTQMAMARFAEDVQSVGPDVLTLQFGLNDCNCWLTDRGLPRTSERAFVANLHEMIARGRHFGAEQVILSTNHPTLKLKEMLSGERFEDANRRYNDLVREVAEDTGVVLCDVARAFDPYGPDELRELLLPYPDCLHLSIEGHRVYAAAILEPLARAVAELAAKFGV